MPRAAAMVGLLAVMAWFARAQAADDRTLLNHCKALVERAAQPQGAGATSSSAPDDTDVLRCRQIIREWTLRDSRMSVDEQGRPLR